MVAASFIDSTSAGSAVSGRKHGAQGHLRRMTCELHENQEQKLNVGLAVHAYSEKVTNCITESPQSIISYVLGYPWQ
jgi:hypothetical protein